MILAVASWLVAGLLICAATAYGGWPSVGLAVGGAALVGFGAVMWALGMIGGVR